MITRMTLTFNHKQRHEQPQKRGMYTPRTASRAGHVQPHVHGVCAPLYMYAPLLVRNAHEVPMHHALTTKKRSIVNGSWRSYVTSPRDVTSPVTSPRKFHGCQQLALVAKLAKLFLLTLGACARSARPVYTYIFQYESSKKITSPNL